MTDDATEHTDDGPENEVADDGDEGTTDRMDGGTMNGMSGEGPVDGPADDQDSRLYGSESSPAGETGATKANGLTAAYYVPLRDVDPRVGVELLTKLGDAGIAAYVAPTPGRQGGYGDVRPPALPTDRLWVDGALRSEAEAVIAGTISEDEVFEQLVAMFHTSAPTEVPWPATEELSPSTRSQTWTTRRSITARQAPVPEVSPDEPALPAHVESYLDEHFVPEPPPPLPRLQAITLLAWALIGFGVLAIVFHDAIPIDFSQGSIYIAACAIVGGFATLVYRMHDDDDDDGDGAVV